MAFSSRNVKRRYFPAQSLRGSHAQLVDEYEIDIDEIYQIEDILATNLKETYSIILTLSAYLPDGSIRIGLVNILSLK